MLLASWSTMAWLRVRQQLLLAKAGHYDFVSATVKDNMLANYFANDPDSRQYWPIFDSDINASNNALINNYGY